MKIAMWFMYLFAMVIAFGFGLVFTGHWAGEGEEFFMMVFPMVTGFMGFTCGVAISEVHI
jgi:hypothetical protein